MSEKIYVNLDCIFLKAEELVSQKGNLYYTATFLYGSDVVKFFITEEQYEDFIFPPGSYVNLTLRISVYRQNLSLMLDKCELAS